MRLKLIFAAGALAGMALAARRHNQNKALDDGQRWSAVTDPVPPVTDAQRGAESGA